MYKVTSPQTRMRITIAFTLLCAISAFAFAPPIPQDLAYFNFADQRTIFGIPNFWDVLSNLPYMLGGLVGLWFSYKAASRKRDFFEEDWEWVLSIVIFASIFMVAFGSGYFHLAPSVDTLFWDRLPMGIAFMAIFSIVFAERVDRKWGKRLAIVLPFVGFASVMSWHYSEQIGQGDLRFYALVQFIPLVFIPVMLAFFPGKYDRTGDLFKLAGTYLAAKVLEHFDVAVFEATGNMMSGHSLKHIVSGLGTLYLVSWLALRRPVNN